MAPHRGRRAAWRLILATAVGVLCVPRDADAQPAIQVAPSLTFMTLFDDNVFVTPERAEADAIVRFTPGLDARYERPLLTMKGHYHLVAERFAAHPSLTTMLGGQDAAVDIRSRRWRSTVLGGDATMTATNTPSELNTLSGLAVGRARASRVAVHPSLVREWDRQTSLRFSYSYAYDQIEAGPRAHTNGAAFVLERRRSARQKVAVTYATERFAFAGAAPILSHASTVGVELSGRSSSANVTAGARVTDGRLSPELALGGRRTSRHGELSIAYTRTTTTVIGVVGAVDTQSLVGAATYDVGGGVRVQAAPGLSGITVANRQVHVFRVAMEVSAPIARTLAVVAGSTISAQQGRVDDQRSVALSQHVLSVGIRVAPPARSRE